MRWVDHVNDMDIFFDRAVNIIIINAAQEARTEITPGVLISSNRVLTSFNPFREHIKHKNRRLKVIISVLYERALANQSSISYILRNFTVACARQIIPSEDTSDSIWHNIHKLQSPLHDLMVIRLNESLKLIYKNPRTDSFSKYYKDQNELKHIAGPMVTQLADKTNRLGRDIKFASLGFLDQSHINDSCHLRTHTFFAEDNVVTDCEGWISRRWGHFFCINNVENFMGVGSGALLIYEHILFGVGSFMLRKGKKSILVFTDVRPYHSLIYKTCTFLDQNLGITTTTQPPPPSTSPLSTTSSSPS